jgi:hypothetical protein
LQSITEQRADAKQGTTTIVTDPVVALFIRPSWGDIEVNRRFPYLMDYLYWVGNNVVNYAKTSDIKILDLSKDDAIKSNVEKGIQQLNPQLIFHTDHGEDTTLTGQKGCTIFCCENKDPTVVNHTLLKDKIVYTLSCNSASKLGQAVIQIGGFCFMGYDAKLRICLAEGAEMDGAFEEIWSGGAKQLLSGKTAKEAFTWVKERYEYWISYWEMRDHWAQGSMLSALRQDLAALKLLGKDDAKIV